MISWWPESALLAVTVGVVVIIERTSTVHEHASALEALSNCSHTDATVAIVTAHRANSESATKKLKRATPETLLAGVVRDCLTATFVPHICQQLGARLGTRLDR